MAFQWAARAAWVDQLGILTAEAARVVQFLLAPPTAVLDAIVLASGESYPFANYGSLAVIGGTGLVIEISRGKIVTQVGTTPGIYPVSGGDTYVVTYATPPILRFIPK